ncbi:MAG: hypothetical protein ACLR8P_12105 [Clostridium fessum]
MARNGAEKIADGGKDFEATVNFDRVGVKNVCFILPKLAEC